MKNNFYQVHPTGPIEVNAISFVLNNILYILDPGGAVEQLVRDAESFKDKEKVVLLTHAHVDHIARLPELVEKLGIKKVFLHPDDIPLYENRENAIPPYLDHPDNLPATQWPPVFPGLEVRHTPGHSRGSVIYYIREQHIAFTGDTIFLESVGRTDLPGGNEKTLIESIRSQIFTLPLETILIPGHGAATSVEYEKKNNPYVRG